MGKIQGARLPPDIIFLWPFNWCLCYFHVFFQKQKQKTKTQKWNGFLTFTFSSCLAFFRALVSILEVPGGLVFLFVCSSFCIQSDSVRARVKGLSDWRSRSDTEITAQLKLTWISKWENAPVNIYICVLYRKLWELFLKRITEPSHLHVYVIRTMLQTDNRSHFVTVWEAQYKNFL